MSDKPAFPLPSKTVEMLTNAGARMDIGGLTRRELFAAMAPSHEIDGIARRIIDSMGRNYDGHIDYANALAEARGIWADALIAELDK